MAPRKTGCRLPDRIVNDRTAGFTHAFWGRKEKILANLDHHIDLGLRTKQRYAATNWGGGRRPLHSPRWT